MPQDNHVVMNVVYTFIVDLNLRNLLLPHQISAKIADKKHFASSVFCLVNSPQIHNQIHKN